VFKEPLSRTETSANSVYTLKTKFEYNVAQNIHHVYTNYGRSRLLIVVVIKSGYEMTFRNYLSLLGSLRLTSIKCNQSFFHFLLLKHIM